MTSMTTSHRVQLQCSYCNALTQFINFLCLLCLLGKQDHSDLND